MSRRDSSSEFFFRSWSRVSPPATHFVNSKPPLPLTSPETSQMVMDRIFSHWEVSPRTSGRLSHNSGPLTAAHRRASLTGSPPFSPSKSANLEKLYRSNYSLNTHLRATVNGSGSAAIGGGKTVGRWLKERKERRKEENRVQNAQLHAAISVAGVAAAIAAVASASASSSGGNDDEDVPRTDIAMASAATLVAAQCVEAAEAMGAEHDHLASVVNSAVNVKTAGDIMTLTAAAATALRGAATLKSRAMREVWNAAAENGMRGSISDGNLSSIIVNNNENCSSNTSTTNGELHELLQLQTGRSESKMVEVQNHHRHEHKFLPVCYRGVLANGCELLKRTRTGDLHWKVVSVDINKTNQVMLKMKSRHVAGTLTKKKKNLVVDVVKDVPAWPGRHLLEGGDDRRYFGVKTLMRGVVEFECRNQREYDLWTQGISKLLVMAADQRICRF